MWEELKKFLFENLRVQFALVLWNPKDPTQYFGRCSNNRFTVEKSSWGSTNYLSLLKNKHIRFLKTIQPTLQYLYVRVFKDPTGELWVDNIPKLKNN